MEIKLKQPKSLLELAQLIGADLNPAAAVLGVTQITALDTLERATPGSVSFLSNQLYKKYLATTQASAVVLAPGDAKHCPATTAVLTTTNPRLALAKILLLCAGSATTSSGVHPSAVLGNNVKLGANVSIGPHCAIGDNCVIGSETTLKANVTLYNDVTIGSNCTVHSGTVIGSDGFGYAVNIDGSWVKMLHLGGVIIGDQVEIGSNTSIDRGMLDNTVIGNQVIIDNLVQIGHNVIIGDRTAIAGCVGIAGSTSIGKYCLIGGAASIQGHLTIGDKVHITGTSAVNHSLLEPGVYSSGIPARENSAWKRNVARFMTLDSMAKRIKELEKAMVGI